MGPKRWPARAGDGGAGGGKGGDLIIRGGDGGSEAASNVFSDSERLVLKDGLEPGRGAEITVVQVGGVDARAGSQIRVRLLRIAWVGRSQKTIGQLFVTMVDASGAGAVEPRGLYLITDKPARPQRRSSRLSRTLVIPSRLTVRECCTLPAALRFMCVLK